MRLTIYFSIFCFLSCSNKQVSKKVDSYFDTKTFFEEQIKSLKSQHIFIEKEMSFNSKSEKVKTDSINWEKELSAFASINLLKPSYAGRFKKDSLFINENNFRLTYSCNDKKTDLKKVEIYFELGTKKVKSVIFWMNETNTIYESEKQLKFYTDSAFRISGKQNIKLTEGINYLVNATFIKN